MLGVALVFCKDTYCRLKCGESRVPLPPVGNWQSQTGDGIAGFTWN
jgi:hypothetical protein